MKEIIYNEEEIKQKVCEIIEEKLSIKPGDYNPEEKLSVDLAADSLDLIEISMELEREFSISITDYQVNEMKGYSVADVCTLVSKMVNSRAL